MASKKNQDQAQEQNKQGDKPIEKHPALVALGQHIRKVRQSQGISQEDFAAQAGIARSYYGSIERGERNVASLNLMRIAIALEVEIGELFPTRQVFEGLVEGEISKTKRRSKGA